MARLFAIDDLLDDALARPPSWNLAPTQGARIVLERLAEGAVRRELRVARWGLVPSWAKDPTIGSKMINARSETLAEKPSFRAALAKRRCLVMADGYYEWQKHPGGAKTPWYIYPADGTPIAFAGLYEFWRERPVGTEPSDDAPWLLTTTIITGTALEELAHIHDRRPIALNEQAIDAWLDPAVGGPEALAQLATPGPAWTAREVSTRVNRVGMDGAENIAAIAPAGATIPGLD